jgi:CHASE3 domain sensor protein
MDEDRQAHRSDIGDELRELGHNLREAFESLRQSPQTQEFRQELNRGLEDLRGELEELLESDDVQRFRESAREAVRDVDKGDWGQQVRAGFVTALKELNTQINRVIAEADQANSGDETPDEPTV